MMCDVENPGVNIQKAREHIAQGEVALIAAKEVAAEIGSLTEDLDLMNAAVTNTGAMAAVATAHFTAAMAITSSILLTDER